jgi:hypothetical protein
MVAAAVAAAVGRCGVGSPSGATPVLSPGCSLPSAVSRERAPTAPCCCCCCCQTFCCKEACGALPLRKGQLLPLLLHVRLEMPAGLVGRAAPAAAALPSGPAAPAGAYCILVCGGGACVVLRIGCLYHHSGDAVNTTLLVAPAGVCLAGCSSPCSMGP